jgi:hypothetical protein
LLAVLAEAAEFVEFAAVTAADHARFGGKSGRFVCEGAFEPLPNFGEFVKFAVQMAKKAAAANGRRGQEIPEHGELNE